MRQLDSRKMSASFRLSNEKKGKMEEEKFIVLHKKPKIKPTMTRDDVCDNMLCVFRVIYLKLHPSKVAESIA